MCAVGVMLTACKKGVQIPAADNSQTINENAVAATERDTIESAGARVIGAACTNGYEINVHWTANPEKDSVTVDVVKDGKSENFKMGQTRAGSGAKFQSRDGHYLWNKGKKYLFGMGEDLVCECEEK